jgi:hypothetical protein
MVTKTETPEEKKERETAENIAESLEKLSRSVEALLKGPLNRKALHILLAAASGMSRSEVERVLTALENLRKDYLK